MDKENEIKERERGKKYRNNLNKKIKKKRKETQIN